MEDLKIAVLGLGYVGLPVAVGFAEHFKDVVGFDVNKTRVKELKSGIDHTLEVDNERLKRSGLAFTDAVDDLKNCNFYVACVPTPINDNKEPDLTPLERVCESIAAVLKKGDIVVFESTVYPGVTEEICGPWLAEKSGLKQGVDFKLGYSPERINPGDKVHRLETINKVVSAEDRETLEIVANAYQKIVTKADIHRAPNIMVAEMSKVIENTQRDVNIGLMNEIAVICERVGIRTADVLAASGSKWNFLPFTPGLVGGHCIGVDPYYLSSRAERFNHRADVILSARRINNSVAPFIATKVVKMLAQSGKAINKAKVGILGLAFKENVGDIRNSKVPDIMKALAEYGVESFVHDPHTDKEEAFHEYGFKLADLGQFKDLDCLIYAVPHQFYGSHDILSMVKKGGVFIDVKSKFTADDMAGSLHYWSL